MPSALPTSALQTDCPGESDYLRVGQMYVCTCRRTSLGNPPGQVQWVTSDGQVMGVSAEDGSWSKLNITYSLSSKSEVLSFTVNGQSGRVSTHLGDVTEFTCTASGSPPPQVSITRTRGVSVVATEESTTSIHHVIPSFTCDDVDEYICQVQNGDGVRQASSVVVGSSCPCKLQPNQPSSVNLTVSVGGNALLTVHLFCSPKPDVFTLTFTLGGSQFEINRQRYSVMYQEETPFYGGANLAMYDMQDGDFRQYTLTVDNGVENSLKFFFSLTKKSSMEEDNGRVVGLAIGLTLTALAIIILSLFVLWFYKRRRRNNSENPEPSRTQINYISSPIIADGVSNGGYHVYEDVDANNGYVSIDNSSGESLYISPRLSNV
ncbi:uncharacterized protein LOC131943173 [Physella acuta]|uniref:uncharacterized protein LOC131943173 n=1 Tax=Physella acuta TaxID=109671 RepID=UPI0027DB5E65|nr:uncharacterized protein LOC131943173 [Physella acuta]